MPEPRKLRVFLCHASQDKPIVRELYQRLLAEGWIDPWLDEEKLLPGQDWDIEIEKAVESADAVIVCLSNNSVNKEGYIQKEIKKVIDVSYEKPEETIFIVPLRLDDCKVPRSLKSLQYVDYFPLEIRNYQIERLINGLSLRAETLEIDTLYLGEPNSYTSNNNPIYIYGEIEFIKVPAGEFTMGSGFLDWPLHKVYIPYFYLIGRYPITNEQYSRMPFKQDLIPLIEEPALLDKPFKIPRGKHDHPVTSVNVHKYLDWLNKDFLHELPENYKFKLPSEAEWEKAARGAIDERVFPWGNEFDKDKCNSKEAMIGDTTPVGRYSPRGDSPFGVSDMVGNVWETTRNINKHDGIGLFYKAPYKFSDGREGHSSYLSKFLSVIRGGSYRENSNSSECSSQQLAYGDFYRYTGFKIVISPER